MPAKSKLRSVPRAIDDAASVLRRARNNTNPDSEHEIRGVLSALDDAGATSSGQSTRLSMTELRSNSSFKAGGFAAT